MNRLVPILVTGAVVVGGGVFLATRSNSDSSGSTGSNSNASSNSVFDAVSTKGLSFKATLVSEKDGKTVTSVMESDAKTGATRYSADQNNAKFTMIYTKDAYYMCQGDENCFKYSLGKGSGASFNPDDYKYDESQVKDFKTKSKSLGQRSCPSGTCDAWETTTENGKATFLIDSRTKRITQAVTESNGTKATVTYEYVDVNVKIPSNTKTIPTINGLGQ